MRQGWSVKEFVYQPHPKHNPLISVDNYPSANLEIRYREMAQGSQGGPGN